MLKTLFSNILFLGLFSCFLEAIAVAQAASPRQADSRIVGTWEWSLDVGPSNSKASIAVEVSDGKLVGEVTAPDGQVLKAEDLRVEKDHVSFSISRDMGVFQMVMAYAGKLDGDKIVGTFNLKGGPMKKSGEWNAKRVKSK